MPKQPHSLWYKDAIFYEVSPRAFMDGNGDGIGDFVGLTSRLDYIAELGVNCIWILPMYPSPLKDDGYDISDYYDIHPQLGTMDDFKTFIAEAKARNLRVDLPDAAGAQMGPIASFAHRDRIAGMVEAARNAGARILTGGAAPADDRLAKGAFYLPTIVSGIDNAAAIACEEIFGPVLCVLPFEDEADLVAQANDSAYGLAAGLWTADYKRAWRVARALEAGTVWINTYKQLSIAAPFGGFKDSGIGREKGITGMRLYQQPKSIYLGLGG